MTTWVEESPDPGDLTAVAFAEAAVVRLGLIHILERLPSVRRVVGSATWRETADILRAEEPDLAVVSGDFIAEQVLLHHLGALAAGSDARLLVLTARSDPPFIRSLFGLGVHGLLHRAAPCDQVATAATNVGLGKAYLDPTFGVNLLGGTVAGLTVQALTDRECQILKLLAAGHTQREIAGQLHISLRTVETHLMHMRRKIGVSNRAELIRFAFAEGLVPEAAS